MSESPQELLLRLFDAAVLSAQAEHCIPAQIPTSANGKIFVVGGGKAAAAMAAVVEDRVGRPLEGVVVVPDGHGAKTRGVQVIEAAHPIPDHRGQLGAQAVLDIAKRAQADDNVIVLLSGGGSALLAKPLDGLSLDQKRELTAQLVRSGATIHEINCVRRHLSAIKGGRLAALISPAPCHVFVISDVKGDDPATIASGPCSPDPTTQAEALSILEEYQIPYPPQVGTILTSAEFETPKPCAPSEVTIDYHIVANSESMMNAVSPLIERAGFRPIDLGEVDGESSEVAKAHAERARAELSQGNRVAIVSRGETTVTHDGSGKGGPNREYALALALALEGASGIHAIACDTDGIDGANEVAGGWIDHLSIDRAKSRGANPSQLLQQHQSARFFELTDQQVITGPTRTNINDFRCILVAP